MNFVNMVSGKIGGAVSWTVDSSWGLGYFHSIPSSTISWVGRNGYSAASWIAEMSWKAACATGRGIEWCWDNRVRQFATAAGFAYLLMDKAFYEGKHRTTGTRAFDFSIKNMLYAFVLSSGVNYLWETKAMWYPLDGAIAKGILANGAVVTLDALSLAALIKGTGGKKVAQEAAPQTTSRAVRPLTIPAPSKKLPKELKKCGLLTKLIAASWIVYRCADIGLEWGNASHGLVQLNFDPTLSMWSRVQGWMPTSTPAVAA